MPTIHAPSDFSGSTDFGSVTLTFKDGVAEYDGELSEGLTHYLTSAGYGIGHAAAEREAAPEPADPRDIDSPTVVGGDLRDAAVDPHPEDYLPPINAGQANPHGPEVVAPGIHAVGPKPIHPGPVGKSGDTSTPDTDASPNVVKDTDAQAVNETALAQSVLIDQTPVPEATAAAAQVDPVNTDAKEAGNGAFDPAEHTVAEVNDYLANADDTERERVLAAERDGKARATVSGI